MSTSAAGGGAALNATVDTTSDPRRQEYLERYADDCERAVKVITEKLEGIKDSLATAKTDAKQARAEAQKGKGA